MSTALQCVAVRVCAAYHQLSAAAREARCAYVAVRSAEADVSALVRDISRRGVDAIHSFDGDVNATDERQDCAAAAALRLHGAMQLEVLRALRCKPGFCVNQRIGPRGSTILSLAARRGPDGVDVMRWALASGASVNQRDDDGATALHYAVLQARSRNYADMAAVKLLLDVSDVDVDAVDAALLQATPDTTRLLRVRLHLRAGVRGVEGRAHQWLPR